MKVFRRNLLIDPPFQIRFIRFVILACVTICAASLLCQYVFIEWLLRVLRDSKALPVDLVLDLVDISSQVLNITAILIVMCAVIIVMLALTYSHRIAGPIFNMKKNMDAFLSGDEKASIKLRKDDYLVDLAEKINEIMAKKKSK